MYFFPKIHYKCSFKITYDILFAESSGKFSTLINLAHQQHLVQLYAISVLKCWLHLTPTSIHPV